MMSTALIYREDYGYVLEMHVTFDGVVTLYNAWGPFKSYRAEGITLD